MIFYEQPLNEKIRTFMRLDAAFNQAEDFIELNNLPGLRNAMSSLVDIITTVSRLDLRNDLLKEIEKCATRLSKLENIPGIDTQILGETLSELDLTIDKLHRQPGHVESSLRENSFLSTIIQRSVLPGGGCLFDNPEYYYWLNQPFMTCKQDFNRWIGVFSVLRTGIHQLLTLIRESAVPESLVANTGFYQATLDASVPYQLIRVGLATSCGCYAEISAGKHRFTIRFLDFVDTGHRSVQTNEDVKFLLARCVL
jgi:cell division protein ZapD